MSDTADERYKEGYEKLREHMRETHAHTGDEVRIPSDKLDSIRGVSGGYRDAIQDYHEKAVGPYKSLNFSEGAAQAVKEWEAERIKEVIAPREKENELMRPFADGEQARLTEGILNNYNLQDDREVRESLSRLQPSELRIDHQEAERARAWHTERIRAW
ncbi:MAG: hypothetical protein ACJ73N_05660 [Bryobacteraceae bacterium]